MRGGQGQRLLEGLGADDLQHRPEDLLAIGAHVRRHPVEQGGADEEAVLIALQLEAAAVDDQFRALVGAQLDVVRDPRLVGAVTTGPYCASGSAERPTFNPAMASTSRPAQLVGGPGAHRDDHRQGHAPLAGRAEGGAGDVAHRLVEVGVGHDDAMVLGPAHGLDPLSVRRARRIDVLGDVGGARRSFTACTRGWLSRPSTAALSPCTTLSRPGGAARLHHQLGQRRGDRGVLLRGLQHEGVAAGDGDAEHPHRDHGREVERGDAGADAQRLAHRIDVDPRAGGPRCIRPLRAWGMPQANSITSRPRWMSPLLSASTLPCSEESRAASSSIRASTRRLNSNISRARRCGLTSAQPSLGAGGGLHRQVDLGAAGEGDARLHLAGVGVEDLAIAAGRRAVGHPAVDEMAERAQGEAPWRSA